MTTASIDCPTRSEPTPPVGCGDSAARSISHACAPFVEAHGDAVARVSVHPQREASRSRVRLETLSGGTVVPLDPAEAERRIRSAEGCRLIQALADISAQPVSSGDVLWARACGRAAARLDRRFIQGGPAHPAAVPARRWRLWCAGGAVCEPRRTPLAQAIPALARGLADGERRVIAAGALLYGGLDPLEIELFRTLRAELNPTESAALDVEERTLCAWCGILVRREGAVTSLISFDSTPDLEREPLAFVGDFA